MMSCGHVPSLSYSQATGRISLTAKSCAISRRFFCSSVSVKSTILGSPIGLAPEHRLTGQSISLARVAESGPIEQQSTRVQSSLATAALDLADNGLSLVVFGAVAFALVISLLLLVTRGSDNMYDQIGARRPHHRRRVRRRRRTCSPRAHRRTRAEQEQEIRQMLRARSERQRAQGRAGARHRRRAGAAARARRRLGGHDAGHRAKRCASWCRAQRTARAPGPGAAGGRGGGRRERCEELDP